MCRSVKRPWVGSSANVPCSRKFASGIGTSGSDQTGSLDDPEIVPVPSATNNANSLTFIEAVMTPLIAHKRNWPEQWLSTGDTRYHSDVNQTRREVFGPSFLVLTRVQVVSLARPELLVEINATAVAPRPT